MRLLSRVLFAAYWLSMRIAQTERYREYGKKTMTDKNLLRRKAAAMLAAATMGSTVHAATIATANVSTVVSIDSYTSYGGGDVIFTLASNSLASSCPFGFWIRGTDAGAKTTLAQVMTALTAGRNVTVSADTSTIWSGAGAAACLVWDVRMT